MSRPRLSQGEARRLTDEARRDAQALWRKLLDLYEGGAHEALGFSSWAAYCKAEFDIRKSHAYRVLDAARVARVFPHGGMTERQARELAPLLDAEDDLVEICREEFERCAGKPPTAARLKVAVEKRLRGERTMREPTARRRDGLDALQAEVIRNLARRPLSREARRERHARQLEQYQQLMGRLPPSYPEGTVPARQFRFEPSDDLPPPALAYETPFRADEWARAVEDALTHWIIPWELSDPQAFVQRVRDAADAIEAFHSLKPGVVGDAALATVCALTNPEEGWL